MEEMSTRRALTGLHASGVVAVDVNARCLDVPLFRDHLHEPAVTHKVSNQTLEHDERSLVRLCHETCCLLRRLLHVNAVDGHVACSHRRTPECRRSFPVNLREPTLVSSTLESSLTSHVHRPDSSAQARSLDGAGRLQSQSGFWIQKVKPRSPIDSSKDPKSMAPNGTFCEVSFLRPRTFQHFSLWAQIFWGWSLIEVSYGSAICSHATDASTAETFSVSFTLPSSSASAWFVTGS